MGGWRLIKQTLYVLVFHTAAALCVEKMFLDGLQAGGTPWCRTYKLCVVAGGCEAVGGGAPVPARKLPRPTCLIWFACGVLLAMQLGWFLSLFEVASQMCIQLCLRRVSRTHSANSAKVGGSSLPRGGTWTIGTLTQGFRPIFGVIGVLTCLGRGWNNQSFLYLNC